MRKQLIKIIEIVRGANLRLHEVYIKNFRNFKEFRCELSEFSIFIGENNSGKSNFLKAINKILKYNERTSRIYFSENDFFIDKSTNKRETELSIRLTFDQLTENDKNAFLNSGAINFNHHTISIQLESQWDVNNKDATVNLFFLREDDSQNEKMNKFSYQEKQYIPFMYIDAYRDIWKETQTSNGDLKSIFKFYNQQYLKPLESINKNCIEITKNFIESSDFPNMEESERDLLEEAYKGLTNSDYEELEKWINLLNEIKRSKGYELDKIIDNYSNLLKKRSISEKIDNLQDEINSLEKIDEIKRNLKENISIFNLEEDIEFDFGKIEESDFFNESKIQIKDIPILRYGSGFQSSFVIGLKLFKYFTEISYSDENISNIIIAIEEPEAHMHPHLQRSMIKKLKKKQNELKRENISAQFIITTHSPYVLSQVDYSDIFILRNNNEDSKVINLNKSLINKVCKEIKETKLKHFNTIFKFYPEIFLSRVIILVEGDSEFGALNEFSKNIENFDLDELGITIVNVESKDSMKYFYIIIKSFTKCIAIRDNEGTNNDEDLIADPNEYYYKTKLKDFEEEIVNSAGALELIKKLIEIDHKDLGKKYLRQISTKIEKFREKDVDYILQNWGSIDIAQLEMTNSEVINHLKSNLKNSLMWATITRNFSEDQIPECYKEVLLKAKEISDNYDR